MMKLAEYGRLRKLMQMTTSDNDHEALASLRAANAILAAHELSWERVFSRTVTVVNEFEPAPSDQFA